MFRWQSVADKTIFDMTVKMYREPFEPDQTIASVFHNIELDHQAYKYLGSELLMYQILDTNFERYIEERGDLSRIDPIRIPISQDLEKSVL
jgi:hypothetical protein